MSTDAPIAVHYTGSAGRPLDELCDRLLAGGGDTPIDRELYLADLAVVVPTRRTARALLRELARRTMAGGLALAPPTVCAPDTAREVLLGRAAPTLGDAHGRELSLAGRLAAAPSAWSSVIKAPPHAADLVGWYMVARHARRLLDELGQAGLTPADAADALRSHGFALEADRVASFQGLEPTPDTDTGPAHRWRCVVVAGVLDLAPSLVSVARRVSGRVDIVVAAPASLAGSFDAHGRPRAQDWRALAPGVSPELVHWSDSPDAAADSAAALALGGDDSTIIAARRALADRIDRAVRVRSGRRASAAWGTPWSATRPAHVLRLACDLAELRTFEAWFDLASHPDVRRALARAGTGAGQWRSLAMAERRSRTLADAPAPDAGAEHRSVFGIAHAISIVLAGLSDTDDAPRPLGEWAARIQRAMIALYHAGKDDAAVGESAEALRTLEGVLGAWTRPDASTTRAAVRKRDALRIALHALSSASIGSARGADAIGVIAWNDALFDPASRLVVCGADASSLPAAMPPSPWLSDTAREAIGLPTRASRLARDAVVLRSLHASGRLTAVTLSRRDHDGSPQTPSPLLIANRDVSRRAIVRGMWEETPARRPDPQPAAIGAATVERSATPLLDTPPQNPERIRITSLRDYLASPFLFYARQVLGLDDARDDDPGEFDALRFGTLVHEAYAVLRGPDTRAIDDAKALEQVMQRRLDRELRAAGAARDDSAAIAVQTMMLQRYAGALASLEARRRVDGWRVLHVETDVPDQPGTVVIDGVPIRFTGRIDRIDVHRETRVVQILDLKTGTSNKHGPRRAHGGPGRWKDLQLPMYQRLGSPLYEGVDASRVETAYVVVGSSGARVLSETWDEAELDDALQTARQIVRGIRAGAFGEPEDATFGDGSPVVALRAARRAAQSARPRGDAS